MRGALLAEEARLATQLLAVCEDAEERRHVVSRQMHCKMRLAQCTQILEAMRQVHAEYAQSM
jgi:hypothetical protein